MKPNVQQKKYLSIATSQVELTCKNLQELCKNLQDVQDLL